MPPNCCITFGTSCDAANLPVRKGGPVSTATNSGGGAGEAATETPPPNKGIRLVGIPPTNKVRRRKTEPCYPSLAENTPGRRNRPLGDAAEEVELRRVGDLRCLAFPSPRLQSRSTPSCFGGRHPLLQPSVGVILNGLARDATGVAPPYPCPNPCESIPGENSLIGREFGATDCSFKRPAERSSVSSFKRPAEM